MNTLIIYASKKGSTKTCGELLQKKLTDSTELISINEVDHKNLDAYDKIILGTPIYAGMFNQAMKNFIATHKSLLKSKQAFLFICSMNPNNINSYIDTNLSPSQRQLFRSITHCGGAFYFSKMNFLEKFIIKKICVSSNPPMKVDTKKDLPRFDEKAINAFTQIINLA